MQRRYRLGVLTFFDQQFKRRIRLDHDRYNAACRTVSRHAGNRIVRNQCRIVGAVADRYLSVHIVAGNSADKPDNAAHSAVSDNVSRNGYVTDRRIDFSFRSQLIDTADRACNRMISVRSSALFFIQTGNTGLVDVDIFDRYIFKPFSRKNRNKRIKRVLPP